MITVIDQMITESKTQKMKLEKKWKKDDYFKIGGKDNA